MSLLTRRWSLRIIIMLCFLYERWLQCEAELRYWDLQVRERTSTWLQQQSNLFVHFTKTSGLSRKTCLWSMLATLPALEKRPALMVETQQAFSGTHSSLILLMVLWLVLCKGHCTIVILLKKVWQQDRIESFNVPIVWIFGRPLLVWAFHGKHRQIWNDVFWVSS